MGTELANTKGREIRTLDSLAMEARALRLSINMNMWQLARVFLEAKEQMPHGQFERWVKENADVSLRTAQDMMAAYKRFGGKPQFDGLGQAKTFKLLPLPEGTEEKFIEEHDVSSMTTREVQAAVKQERARAQAEIQRERNARIAAEQRAAEAENRPPKIPDSLAEALRTDKETIARRQAEVELLAAMGNDAIARSQQLSMENAALQRELQERDELLAEQQADLSRAQQELLNIQSAIAKGDAERTPADQLTPNAFASAVRAFIGTCARMPHMRAAFSQMPQEQKQEYSVLLETVETWAKDSRMALETIYVNGTVIYDE